MELLANSPVPARRVERRRHEAQVREVTVHAVTAISPHFLAVTFRGEALAGFRSDGFDDHVKFIFPGPGGQALRRDFTPRRYDTAQRTLTLEFALDHDGPAAHWARHARPGDAALIAGPRSSMVIDPDHAWHLLAGDLTALPAIQRRTEELPAQTPILILLQLPDTAQRQAFARRMGRPVRWVDDGAGLVSALRALELPPGEGFAWAAGEAATMAALRQVLVEEKSLPAQAMRIAAYWKSGLTGFHEHLASPPEGAP